MMSRQKRYTIMTSFTSRWRSFGRNSRTPNERKLCAESENICDKSEIGAYHTPDTTTQIVDRRRLAEAMHNNLTRALPRRSRGLHQEPGSSLTSVQTSS